MPLETLSEPAPSSRKKANYGSTTVTYTYPSPLAVYDGQDLEPLDDTKRNADGKSLVNPPRLDGGLSKAYERFDEPIVKDNAGFDFHSEWPLPSQALY